MSDKAVVAPVTDAKEKVEEKVEAVRETQDAKAQPEEQQAPDFDQDAINKYVEKLKKECKQKGNEYAKAQFESFGQQAKKVVADNVRYQTQAYEVEQQMVVHLE